MSKHLSANPDFITAFVSECFTQGLNEKQASELLVAYKHAELYRTDKDFREGLLDTLKEESTKEASSVPKALWGLVKALAASGKNNSGLLTPIGLGIAGGALTPSGILSDDYAGGAGAGAGLGALLGLLGTRGRGLGGAVRNLGNAVAHGGVGRTLAKQTGSLLTNPTILKNTAKGALGGAAAAGTVKFMNNGLGVAGRYPSVNPNTGVPWYMQQSTQGAAGQPGANPDMNPFALPPEIMAGVAARQGGGATPGAIGAGPLNQIQAQKSELLNLNTQISQLESNLPLGSNPALYAQRQAMQSELDNLKMKRNVLSRGISQAEAQVTSDKSRIGRLALERQQAANTGLGNAQSEYDMLLRRKQIAGEGGISGGLMGLYNRVTGMDNRLNELAPIYTGYQQQAEEARKLQELAR